MPADERIKIMFESVYVKDDADTSGSGEWYFIASVDGSPVGDRSRIFKAIERRWMDLPGEEWSAIVDVRDKSEVRVEFQARDEDVFVDEDLGTITYTLREPWQQKSFKHATPYFILEWRVELFVGGRFGIHPPNAIFACRECWGSVLCTTVNGSEVTARMEIHPVRPVPTEGLPSRFGFLGSPPEVENAGGVFEIPEDLARADIVRSDENIIPNPSVIPILTEDQARGPRGRALAARVEFTYYRPNTLAFTDEDPRLEWSFHPTSGAAAVQFIGPPQGLKVLVYGIAPGEIRLEVRFNGALFATYRALVTEIRQIPYRANILYCSNDVDENIPRATPDFPANVQDHIAVANRFLRQIGLELIPDLDASRSDNATATDVPGVFQIRVRANIIRNVGRTFPRASRLNARPNVLNIAYIHSIEAPRGRIILGRATDFAANRNAVIGADGNPRISDNGIPTTSWFRPPGSGCGVPPDPNPAGPVEIEVLPRIQRENSPNLFAFLITDGNGDPSTPTGIIQYGKTIAHELGHVLTLRHRTGDGPDGLGYPPFENVMCQGLPPILTQDFDIIQALALRGSPLVPL